MTTSLNAAKENVSIKVMYVTERRMIVIIGKDLVIRCKIVITATNRIAVSNFITYIGLWLLRKISRIIFNYTLVPFIFQLKPVVSLSLKNAKVIPIVVKARM